ncbi:MAG TPA: type II secretion system F family protein [Methylomirabilota bacterium]|nr:type II secretion system F family protein [Methylomirabilota bacterium]
MAAAIAILVFIGVFSLVLGGWWAAGVRRRVRERLVAAAEPTEQWTGVVQDSQAQRRGLVSLLSRTELYARLTRLVEQAGRRDAAPRVVTMIAVFAALGGVVGAVRLGGAQWSLLLGLIGGALPVLYLLYLRRHRVRRFSEQFPEALEMMSRAIRAGHALAGSIQLVGDEMPDPVGQELKRVFEEIRLGLEPGEALEKLAQRMPTEDVRFFCTALRIQRASGGNLAETLDRLSEVIRERYKLLSHARVISAQQRWAAIVVGFSPVGLALLLLLVDPNYFTPALKSPYGSTMIMVGLALEAIGFTIIWRIAKIKV